MKAFPAQASTDVIMSTFIYTVGAVAVVLVIVGLVFVDTGLVRRRNVLDTTVQKIGAAMVGGLGTLLIGYPIWQWQFNQAFGVPVPAVAGDQGLVDGRRLHHDRLAQHRPEGRCPRPTCCRSS